MFRKFTAGLALTALIACGKGGDQQAAADSLARDLELAPAESTTALNDQPTGQQPAPAPAPTPQNPTPAAPKPRPTTPAPTPAPSAPATRTMTLASGTTIEGTANDSLHSRHDKVGKTFRVTVAQDMKDANGRVAIPAGSVVTFKVMILEPAKNKNDADGRVRIAAQEVSIGGSSYPISAEAGTKFIEHDLQGQGVTAGGAVRVGAGAAGGAVAGKVVGGKTGAVVGGIAGAVGGAVLANQTADRDVIVAPGFKVIFTLTSDFTVTR
ncbi:MAG: hypothetical protein SF070_02935 [Gemmatimonadota bacterium]|nr:hypothetical protein [Gemmatimonadota bacterium]